MKGARWGWLAAVLMSLGIGLMGPPPAGAQDGAALVRAAFDHFRGQASQATVVMTVHRPDWQRSLTIEAWTRGQEESIFRIVDPPKDRGNGTLKKGPEMWMYNPKVNRIIKLPPSMMSQAWMGSDFSNNDLAKTDSLLKDYRHTITGQEMVEGQKVFSIESLPLPQAPVVWGLQRLKIREDGIFLRQEFYDEDKVLVKAMDCQDLGMLGGRIYPRHVRMAQADKNDEYTMVEYRELKFLDSLPDRVFTLDNLKNLVR